MKHYITGDPGTDEWKEQFKRIRENFISEFEDTITKFPVVTFKAFDQEEGQPVGWVFKMTDSAMLYEPEGSVDDAKTYLRNMIDSGMRVAYSISPDSVGWLTCWETPAENPEWPFEEEPKSQSIHLGVSRIKHEN